MLPRITMKRTTTLLPLCRCLVVMAVLFLLSACAGQTANLAYTNGTVVETLSAAVSLSYSSGEKGMGGSGYLVYRRPDLMRLIILSPFGTTLMEIYVNGERVTIVYPGKGAAFAGRLADLPERGESAGWRQVRWVMEVDPPGTALRDGTLERVTSLGMKERVTFENGLVTAKALSNGDEARYGDFAAINGVPLATEIIMENVAGDRFRLKLNEPEVNTPFEADVFTPRLDGLTVYPLAALQGS